MLVNEDFKVYKDMSKIMDIDDFAPYVGEYDIQNRMYFLGPHNTPLISHEASNIVQDKKTLLSDKNHFDNAERSGWITNEKSTTDFELKPIEYNVNSKGFRSEEFNSKDEGIIFLGCSHTVGYAQHFDKTWAGIVSNHFNKKCWNLAGNGFSLDSCYRVLKVFINEFKAKYVCLFPPFFKRVELAYSPSRPEEPISFGLVSVHGQNGPLTSDILPQYLRDFEQKTISNFEYVSFNWNRSMDAIKHVCNENGKVLITPFTSDELFKQAYYNLPENQHSTFARDGSHFGEYGQALIASRAIEKIKS